jgi:peptidoglycan/LPS O-acetylase OafA/YrhL
MPGAGVTDAEPTGRPAPERLAELDGIRGWASLMALLYHALPEVNRGVLPELESAPATMLFDGPLAVQVFFILSGAALSAGYLHSGDIGIVRTLAVRRYFRLTIPILMASALVWFAMVGGLDAHRQAAVVLRSDWLARCLAFRPSLGGMFWYALVGVYLNPPAALQYVPLLWTMPIELFGSCCVFSLLTLMRRLTGRRRLACYAAVLLAFGLLAPVLACFAIGILLAEAHERGWLERLRRSRLRGPAILLALLLLAGISAVRATAYQDFIGRDAPMSAGSLLLRDANALGLFLLVWLVPGFARFMGGRLSGWLGKISFPLYLVQFAVLITLTAQLSVWLVDPARPARAVLYGIAAATVAASLVLAYGFGAVERRALRGVYAALARLV